jgi:hypothetical protein
MLGAGTLISSALLGPLLLRDSAPPLLTTSSMVYLMMMVSFARKPRAGSSRMLRCVQNVQKQQQHNDSRVASVCTLTGILFRR